MTHLSTYLLKPTRFCWFVGIEADTGLGTSIRFNAFFAQVAFQFQPGWLPAKIVHTCGCSTFPMRRYADILVPTLMKLMQFLLLPDGPLVAVPEPTAKCCNIFSVDG